MSLAIALVVVMPRRLRPAAAVVGVALALAVSFSIVSLGWHFPSDVVGGYLLATGWALVLLAGPAAGRTRAGRERTWRTGLAAASRRTVEALAAVGLAAILVGTAVALAAAAVVAVVMRPTDFTAYAQEHTAFWPWRARSR